MYVEMIDGLYAPIGLRKPAGTGPFPIVVFASGNGGGGMAVIRDHTQNRSWTQEQFLAAGYAVAWLRYRAEVDYAYDKIGKLVEDIRQGRQLLNRGPLEYEDAISVVKYLKTLPCDRCGSRRLSRHEPRRRDGVQDRLRIRRHPCDGRERTGHARIPAAAARRNREDQSGDGPAQCRAHADARAGQGAKPDHGGCRQGAHQHDQDADFRAWPRSRRTAGDIPRVLRPAQGGGQGRALGNLRSRRARLHLRAAQ